MAPTQSDLHADRPALAIPQLAVTFFLASSATGRNSLCLAIPVQTGDYTLSMTLYNMTGQYVTHPMEPLRSLCGDCGFACCDHLL